jgi:hypothetical protein
VRAPTLASIAESHAAGYWQEFRLLAREIIELREYTEQQVGVLHDRFETDTSTRLDSHNRVMTSLTHRIRALEVGRGGDDDFSDRGCICPWDANGDPAPPRKSCAIHGDGTLSAMRLRAEAAERERDELIEREHELVCQREDLRQSLADEISKADAARATVERLSAALKEIEKGRSGTWIDLREQDRRIAFDALWPADALKETPDA